MSVIRFLSGGTELFSGNIIQRHTGKEIMTAHVHARFVFSRSPDLFSGGSVIVVLSKNPTLFFMKPRFTLILIIRVGVRARIALLYLADGFEL